MIKVYTPAANFDIYKEWLGNSSKFERCNDISQVLLQEIKIACVPIYFNEINDSRYDFDYTKFDLLLISAIEFAHIRPIREWLATYNIKNYLIALGGMESDFGNVTSDFVYRPWWTFNLVNKNTDQYQDIKNKPYVFDMLLGAKKPHRDWILAKSIESGLEKTSICNYRDVFPAPVTPDSKINVTVPYPFISTNMKQEYEVAENINFQVSDRVPWKIYEQTRYSIIPETVYERSFFFSEKPAKVLMARRLFVVFSNYQYLKTMREELGFKSFNGIIDESYDEEPDTLKRFEMAFAEMLKLADKDFVEVQELSHEIREFNYQRLYTLQQEKYEHMENMVYNKLKEITHANSLF